MKRTRNPLNQDRIFIIYVTDFVGYSSRTAIGKYRPCCNPLQSICAGYNRL
jgi:hypothetical protein